MTKYKMPHRLTPHLNRQIAKGNAAIEAQYRQDMSAFQGDGFFSEIDPLREDTQYSKGNGIVHKFNNRILWKVTYRCAAHCQFCTRYRQIGRADGDLSVSDISAGLSYVEANRNIDDVILSGGDPFYVPQVTSQMINGLSKIDSVRVIRIGTRLPVHSPLSFNSAPLKHLVGMLGEIRRRKAIYVLIHFNHPDELTDEVCLVLEDLTRAGMILLSQTVFLKGINDDKDTLLRLFQNLFYRGVTPYYIYRCDYVRGLERFVCDFGSERQIMTQITKELSGIAVPTYVVDVVGRGKIPVPLTFWDPVTLTSGTDFDGIQFSV